MFAININVPLKEWQRVWWSDETMVEHQERPLQIVPEGTAPTPRRRTKTVKKAHV